jgi:hypothetical protein
MSSVIALYNNVYVMTMRQHLLNSRSIRRTTEQVARLSGVKALSLSKVVYTMPEEVTATKEKCSQLLQWKRNQHQIPTASKTTKTKSMQVQLMLHQKVKNQVRGLSQTRRSPNRVLLRRGRHQAKVALKLRQEI